MAQLPIHVLELYSVRLDLDRCASFGGWTFTYRLSAKYRRSRHWELTGGFPQLVDRGHGSLRQQYSVRTAFTGASQMWIFGVPCLNRNVLRFVERVRVPLVDATGTLLVTWGQYPLIYAF